MASDVKLKTPVKLPSSPMHWYSVDRDLKVDTTPTAATRRKVIYTWRVRYKDGSSKDYTGKTVQSLIKRTRQHIEQAKKAKPKDVFHRSLREFAKNPPGTQITAVSLGVSRIVPLGESLSKTEQVYISGKQTCVQHGGLNQINANAKLRKRLDGIRKNLMIDFQDSLDHKPRQMIVHPI